MSKPRSKPQSRWLAVLAGALLAGFAHAGALHIEGVAGAYNVPVSSLGEARWQTVVHQRYDYSCGSAAISTLLTYHYDMPTPEAAVFKAMFRVGDQRKIRTYGFSMLDMKRYLDSRGLHSDGFRMTLDQIAKIGVPMIALVNTRGYKHFVVIKGIEGDRVLLADPAAGSVALPRRAFERIWDGPVLAARGRINIARAHFNTERDWRIWPQPPIAEGRPFSGLGMFTLNLPGINEFGR
ncbi:MAG: C39 family peptidase [Gammaproteobacteria bacterium]